jgi:hypothetical protein
MFMRINVARIRWIVLSAAVHAACLFSAGAAHGQPGMHDPRTRQLVDGLGLPAPLRGPLQAAVLEAVRSDDCDDTEIDLRLVDLNGDTIPEVHLTANGPCIDSHAGGANWVFVRGRTGEWRPNLDFNGGLLPLPSRSQGFVDIIVAGPGFTAPVWRWDGAQYSLFCFAAEGPDAQRHTCPRSLVVREAAEDLRPFTRRAPRVLGQDPEPGTSPASPAGSPLVGEWRVQETMEGNVTGWPTRCTTVGTLRVRMEAGALVGHHRTERMECRNPNGSFRQGPWENRFAVDLSDAQVSFSPVEGCPYTATLSSAEMRGALECTISDEGDEPMRVYGEWVATRVSSTP